MKVALNQNSTLWDMGVSDLIEELPNLPEEWSTKFQVVTDRNASNVFLMRPAPSWKSSPKKAVE